MIEKSKTIDEYIIQFEPDIQKMLQELRQTIKKYCPDAIEKISWSMPSFYQNGYIIQFMLHKKHIGLYPGTEVIEVLKDRLSEFKTTKGGIQLPIDKPLPHNLIKEIVEFKINLNKM